MQRCEWAEHASEIEQRYHDNEWGIPVHDDRVWFEFITLEGAQAGLSWSTILNKRIGYQQAFDHFDVEKVAQYNAEKIATLIKNPAIVRNKLKVKATVTNAQSFITIQQAFGRFDHYIWQFVDNKPLVNHWELSTDVPTHSSISDALSKDLKQRGFKFIGTTICYALMQATGMVDDHTKDCFCYQN
ncbi:MAG: DNA-3-methyladenine glycosylase I [Cocleimonas sp.]|nr:DNA-3-methyladenine glycosylase I [Cocleimonas sp.]